MKRQPELTKPGVSTTAQEIEPSALAAAGGKAEAVSNPVDSNSTTSTHDDRPAVDMDTLAAELLSVLSAGESSSMKAGELIFQRVFEGDAVIFEKNRQSKKYLRDLLSRDELKIAKATLSRALRAAAQRSTLPVEAQVLPYSLRAELLVIKDANKRNALALAAATEDISRSQLIRRISEARKSIAKPSKHSNTMARVVKLSKGLRDIIAQSGLAAVGLGDAESREYLKELGANLREIDQWFKGLMAGVDAPVAPEAHKSTVSAELDDDKTEDDEPAEEPDDEDLENHEPEDDEPDSDDSETREFVDE